MSKEISQKKNKPSSRYYLYILKCHDSTLYTGITTDLERRIKEHNFSDLGARYTHARRPVELVYYKKMANRSLASREEYRVKNLTRPKKLEIIAFKASNIDG